VLRSLVNQTVEDGKEQVRRSVIERWMTMVRVGEVDRDR
jgi:hypothetical protein